MSGKTNTMFNFDYDLMFMECDTCRAKSGSPILCSGCLHNREIIERLHEFYLNVANLTVSHDVENGKACVYSDKLSKVLKKVDPKWYKDIK